MLSTRRGMLLFYFPHFTNEKRKKEGAKRER
jgi:hypothetical protein